MRFPELPLPSNKNFGVFISAVLFLASTYFIWTDLKWLGFFMGVLAVIFISIVIVKDDLLLPLNKLWQRLGLLLGTIVSPLVLGVLYFFIFTPIAFFMRISGRDELSLIMHNKLTSWKQKDTQSPTTGSFKKQF